VSTDRACARDEHLQMRTLERDQAEAIAHKGLRMLDKVLDELSVIPREDWSKTHVRDISECVMAAVKFQAEQRAQLEWEAKAGLKPDDIRAALKDYLASLPRDQYQALLTEAGIAVPPSEVHA
jgi:hypothetical protein